jgi:hypothetical protein
MTTPMPPDQMSAEDDLLAVLGSDYTAMALIDRALAAAQERARREENEACAKVVEDRCKGEWVGVEAVAAAIRARVK